MQLHKNFPTFTGTRSSKHKINNFCFKSSLYFIENKPFFPIFIAIYIMYLSIVFKVTVFVIVSSFTEIA